MSLRLLFSSSCFIFLTLAAPLSAQSLDPAAPLDRLHLPADELTFIENQGQWPGEVRFLAQLNGANVWVTLDGLVYHFYHLEPRSQRNEATDQPVAARSRVVQARFEGAQAARAEGHRPLSTYYNYFLGNDPARWATRVPLYREVTLHDLADGVTLRLYAQDGTLRHDLALAPGTDPSAVRIRLERLDGLALAGTDRLDRETLLGLTESPPASRREPRLPATPPSHGGGGELLYARYLGGGRGERVFAAASGPSNSFFMAGETSSEAPTPFPTSPITFDSTFSSTDSTKGDAYVARLSFDLDQLLYSSYLGGERFDNVRGMTFGNGSIYVTGITNSSDFPKVNGLPDTDPTFFNDQVFVTKFSPDGTELEFSTFVGGNDGPGESNDGGRDIALAANGSIVISGVTFSSNFPTTDGSSYDNRGDIFVARLSGDGTSLLSSTLLGGNEREIPAEDAMIIQGDNIYVTGVTGSDDFGTLSNTLNGGEDAFVLRLADDGVTVRNGIYLGGSGDDEAHDLSLDDEGNVYVAGETGSANFPVGHTLAGASDAFILQLSPSLETLTTTAFGGNGEDIAYGVDVAIDGSIHVVGTTTSDNGFPTTAGAQDVTFGGDQDAFVMRLEADLEEITYGTYLGGAARDEAYRLVGGSNQLTYVLSETSSSTLSSTSGDAFQGPSDAYLAVYDLRPNTHPTVQNPLPRDTTLAPGGLAFRKNLNDVFFDLDNDDLVFGIESVSDPSVVSATIQEDTLIVNALTESANLVDIVVSADDQNGGSTTDMLGVRVENTPPFRSSEIPDLSLVVGTTSPPRNLNDFFDDNDDGQELTFECDDDNTFVTVTCSSQGILTVTADAVGTDLVVVTANDGFTGDADVARDTFEVRVRALPTEYEATLSGVNATPPTNSRGMGQLEATLNGNMLAVSGGFSELEQPLTAAELRIAEAGASGDLISTLISQGSPPDTFLVAENTIALENDERAALIEGRVYVLLSFGAQSIRGQLLPSPNDAPDPTEITAPNDGTVVMVGPGEPDLTVEWGSAMDPDTNRTVYVWELAPTLNFEAPLIARNTEEQTAVTVTSATLVQLLKDASEEEVTWFHRVSSTDGSRFARSGPLSLTFRQVINPPPVPVGIPNITLAINDIYEANLDTLFTDDDDLNYEVECVSGDCDSPIQVRLFGARNEQLFVRADAIGIDTVIITAMDGVNAAVPDSFVVTVSDPTNQPPRVVSALRDTTVVLGSAPFDLSLNGVFTDDDEGNDASLTFTCRIEEEGTASVSIDPDCNSDRKLTVTPGETPGMTTITVEAKDPAGASADMSFTVTVQALTFDVPPVSAVSGQPVEVTASLNLELDQERVVLQYRPGGTPTFTTADMDPIRDSYSATISVNSEGAEFFVEVVELSGNSLGESDRFDIEVRVAEPIAGGSLPAASAQVDAQNGYRLVSVPLALDDPTARSVFDEFEPDSDAEEQVVRRLFEILPPGQQTPVSAAEDTDQWYREGPNGISLTPGKAVWLITRDGGSFSVAEGSTTRIDEPFSYPLHVGWNLVSTPFNFDIQVPSQVSLASGELELHAYEGSWSMDPAVMRPFAGYALRVNEATELRINPSADASARPSVEKNEAAKSTTPAWAVRIAATVQQARDDNNLALVAPAATDGHDALDWYEPPPIGGYISVAFAPADGGAPLTVDARPVPEEGVAWPLIVRSNIRGEVDLAFSGLEDVPAHFVAWLVDQAAGTVTDLRRAATYAFASQGNSAPVRMRLIVGTEAFAQTTSGFDGTVPSDFQLSQNYPNPFQSITTIQYGLPTDEHVVLEVFDVVGRRVAVLVDEEQEAGYHKAVWSGRGSPPGPASGVYVYRLRAGSFVATERMVVVR